MDQFQFLTPQEIIAVYDKLTVGIYILDPAGKVLFVNDTMVSLTGIPRDRMIGESIFVGVPFSESITKIVFDTKQKVTAYQDINNKISGRKYRQLITSIPIFDAFGEIKYVIAANEELSSLSERLTNAALLENTKVSIEAGHPQADREGVIAESPQMKAILSLIQRISPTSSSVLIEGESGTGKEVIAALVHKGGQRHGARFITVNCAALPEQLLEGELFGYVKGAFTGASSTGKKGLMEEADGGTLFLDEVNSLPLSIQGKLLRVLETKRIRRLGATEEIGVDFRLIAATNQDLRGLCNAGAFREDLYYRLNVVPILLPPLRQRREDIIPLVQAFLDTYIQLYGRILRFSSAALQQLCAYDWPGNVRELRNVVERIVVSSDQTVEEIQWIPDTLLGRVPASSAPAQEPGHVILLDTGAAGGLLEPPSGGEAFSLELYMAQAEERLLRQLAEQCRTLSEMAKILKVDRTNVGRKMKRYGITLKQHERSGGT